jgi:hypothetical protein
MNDQTRSDDLPKTALEGVSKALGAAQDLSAGTRPLDFKPRCGVLFNAEVALDGEDFIFHFYMPVTGSEEAFFTKLAVPAHDRRAFFYRYWDNLFPAALDVTARLYFKAEHPRLEASHMSETQLTTQFNGKSIQLDSWWMRAKNFVNNTLDPDAFVERFYLALEEALTNKKRM